MKDKVIIVEMLIEKIEQYGKTNFDLFRLKAIDKVTDVFASVATRLVFFSIIILFFMLITIGLSLYIGDLLGKSYLGFFVMAGFYFVVGLIFYIIRHTLDDSFNNFLINQIFKEKEDANYKKQ
jgi:hypothetical protein